MIGDMNVETAEANDVVAAMCCGWCAHGGTWQHAHCRMECRKLGCLTFPTDVCKHFTADRGGIYEKEHGNED